MADEILDNTETPLTFPAGVTLDIGKLFDQIEEWGNPNEETPTSIMKWILDNADTMTELLTTAVAEYLTEE